MALQEPNTTAPKTPEPTAPAENAEPAPQPEAPGGEPKETGANAAPKKKAGMGGTIEKQDNKKAADNNTGTMGTEDTGLWTYIWLGLLAALIVFLWRRGHLARLKKHIGETREQLKKCTWPTRNELKQHTVVVLMSTLLLAAFIVVADVFVQFVVWDMLLGSN